MTIDECIDYAEEQSKWMSKYAMIDIYKDRSEYYRQLAEWLRELKTHREIHDILLQTLVDFDLDICCEDLAYNEEEQRICEENCTNNTKSCWVRWAKMKAREVRADEIDSSD